MSEGENKFPVRIGDEIDGRLFHILHRMIFVRRVVCGEFDKQFTDWDSGATYSKGDVVRADGEFFVWYGSSPGNHNPLAADGHNYWLKSVANRFESFMMNRCEGRLNSDGNWTDIADMRPPAIWWGEYPPAGADWEQKEWAKGSLVKYNLGGKWYKPAYSYRAKKNTEQTPTDSSGSTNSDWTLERAREPIGWRDIVSYGVGRPVDLFPDKIKYSYQAAVEYIANRWTSVRPARLFDYLNAVTWSSEYYTEGGRFFGAPFVRVGDDVYVSRTYCPPSGPPGDAWYKVTNDEVFLSTSDLRHKCNGRTFEKLLDELGDFDMHLDFYGQPVWNAEYMRYVCGLGGDCPELTLDSELAAQQGAYGAHDVHPVWRRCWKHTMGYQRWRANIDYLAGQRVTHIDPDGKAWEFEALVDHKSTALNAPHLKNLENSSVEEAVWSAPDWSTPEYYPAHSDIYSGEVISRYDYVQTPHYINGWVWGTWDMWEENHDEARAERHAHEEIPAKIMNDMYNVLLRCDSADGGGSLNAQAYGYGENEDKDAAISAARSDLINNVNNNNWYTPTNYPGENWLAGRAGFLLEWDYDYEKWYATGFALRAEVWSDIATRLFQLGVGNTSLKVKLLYDTVIPATYPDNHNVVPDIPCGSVTIQGGTRIYASENYCWHYEFHPHVLGTISGTVTNNYFAVIPDAIDGYAYIVPTSYNVGAPLMIYIDWDDVTDVLCNI